MRAGVAIVGGGMMGAWALLEASRGADPLGAPAVLFDARASDELAATDCPLISEAFVPGELIGLARKGIREAANFETNTGRPISFGRPGALVLGCDKADAIVEGLVANRFDGASVLGGLELERVFRGLSTPKGERGIWLPEVGHLDVERYLRELMGLARTRGAITRFGVEVVSVCVEDGDVVGLETSSGFCESSRVLLTSEAPVGLVEVQSGVKLDIRSTKIQSRRYSAPLVAEESGLELLGKSPVASAGDVFSDPAKLESFFAPGEAPTYAHPALLDCERGIGVYCEPMSGSLLVKGVTRFDSLVGGGSLPGDALERVLDRVPFHGETLQPIGDRKEAVVQTSPSGLPCVGAVPGVRGLFVAMGLGERGVELAPGIAEGLNQLMNGREVGAFDAELLATFE